MSFLWGDEHCVSVVSLRGAEPFKVELESGLDIETKGGRP